MEVGTPLNLQVIILASDNLFLMLAVRKSIVNLKSPAVSLNRTVENIRMSREETCLLSQWANPDNLAESFIPVILNKVVLSPLNKPSAPHCA